MNEKRFTTNGYKIYDTFHDGTHWLVNQVEADEIVDKMNNLDSKARERSKALSKLQKENEQLKQTISKIDFAIIRKYDNSLENLLDEVYDGEYNNWIQKQVLRAKKLEKGDVND